jgi:OOP family OmpA-OmpF porin
MKKYLFLAAFAALLQTNLSAQDIEGSKDHPLFNRISGFVITDYRYEEFGSEEFYDENDNSIIVEGEKTYIYYESEELVAPLKIIRNYVNAAKEIGGKAVEYTGNRAFINIRKDGKEIWASVYAGDYYYTITIVEKADVKQEITANDILKDLNTTGKAVLYINFDSGKSTIKEESKPVISQIIQLLDDNSDINLSIEGHTDNQGDNASNLALSENRAKAVMNAIIAGGISGDRLSSKGFGEDKPVADNSTEEGRAKNRRVELIKK